MAKTDPIMVKLSTGKEIPLRYFTSKSDNDCYGTLGVKDGNVRYFSRYGVNVSADLIGGMPETVKLGSTTLRLEDAEHKKGYPVKKGRTTVKVNGEDKELDARFTEILNDDGEKTGVFNINVSIHGKRGGGGRALVDAL